MASFNKVILLGNLTRDPEVRYTPKGTAVTELGMAVNRVYTAENGEKREEITFVDVTFWGRTAEIAGEYLKKGRPVFIEGRLQLDTWDDKQSGQKRSKLKVVGEGLQLIGSRPGGGGGGGGDEEGSGAPRSSQARAAPESSSLRPRRRRDSVLASVLVGRDSVEPPASTAPQSVACQVIDDPHRSLHRAEHASDHGAGAVAQAPGSFRNARSRSGRAARCLARGRRNRQRRRRSDRQLGNHRRSAGGAANGFANSARTSSPRNRRSIRGSSARSMRRRSCFTSGAN